MQNRILTFCIFFAFYTLTAQQANFRWVNQITGLNDAISNGSAIDTSGNIYTTGTFSGTADFDPSNSVYNLNAIRQKDIYITKVNAAGNFIWAKNIGSIGNDEGVSIAVDIFNNIYITGYYSGTTDFNPDPVNAFNLTPFGGSDIFITCMDTDGNFKWARSIGGRHLDVGNSIITDKKGGIYTCGYFRDTVNFTIGNTTIQKIATKSNDSISSSDLFIAKCDKSGNFVWVQTLGGNKDDEANGLALDSFGNIYATGNFQDTIYQTSSNGFPLISDGMSDIFVFKLDNDGFFKWALRAGGDYGDAATAITSDPVGNLYLTGYFYDVADFNPGAPIFNLTAKGNRDIFILNLDFNGNFGWVRQMGGTSDDAGLSIAIDAFNNVYTSGCFWGTADFNPVKNKTFGYPMVSKGKYDIFITKTDASNQFKWARSYGGESTDFSTCINTDQRKNIYFNGYFNGTVDFNPEGSSVELTASAYDAFLIKLDQCIPIDTRLYYIQGFLVCVQDSGNYQWIDCDNNNLPIPGETNRMLPVSKNGNFAVIITVADCSAKSNCKYIAVNDLNEIQYKPSVHVFPNPAKDELNIRFETLPEKQYTITLFDQTGKCIMTLKLEDMTTMLNLNALAAGIYTIHVPEINYNGKISIVH